MAPTVDASIFRRSNVRQIWQQGKAATCVASHVTDPTICEMLSLMGFDCIWIDMEHHATSVETASNMFRAARVNGTDIMARPGKGEFMRMGRMLETGANGILYPRCDDAAEAAEVVKWAKFAPLGQRGLDGVNVDGNYGLVPIKDYVEWANRETWIAVQIESPHAVENARAIADVEGVDMLFFGPGDYSLLTGRPGNLKCEETARASQAVCKAALLGGKRFGTPSIGLDHAREMLDMGATFLTIGSDITLLRNALRNLREQYAPIVPGPSNNLTCNAVPAVPAGQDPHQAHIFSPCN